MLHAFAGDELAGDLLEPVARALDEKDFEGVMVLEVDPLRGDDLLQPLVLDIEQARGQSRLRVVVDDGDGPRHDALAEFVLMLHELLADHLGDSLRTAGITALGHHVVELIEQRDRE